MKKILVVLLVMVMLCCLTACDFATSIETKYESDLIEKIGFVIIEQKYAQGDVSLHLVYDPETKVEYLIYNGYRSYSLCPYYDENGNIAIYKGD